LRVEIDALRVSQQSQLVAVRGVYADQLALLRYPSNQTRLAHPHVMHTRWY
jgi:hypothetical protein